MANIKTTGFEIEGQIYEFIPPSPTETQRGGVIASPKTENDTVEVRLGVDGKLYAPTYPDNTNAIHSVLNEAKIYTDQVKSDIYGGVPNEMLDTITELAKAMEENSDVVDALNSAITNKAEKVHTHSFDDLQNKPFGEEVTIVVPETNCIVENNMWTTQVLYPFIVDETYTVIFDEEEYECVCINSTLEGMSSIGLGNASLYGGGEDTGEPFAVGVIDAVNLSGIFATDGNHTFSVVQKEIVKLPDKYIDADWMAKKTVTEDIVYIPEQSFTFEATLDLTSFNFKLQENNIYSVTYNGTVYKNLIAVYNDSFLSKPAIGIVGMNTDTTEGFVVLSTIEDNKNMLFLIKDGNFYLGEITITLKLTGESVSYSTLPEQYLPEERRSTTTFTEITTDTVNQMAILLHKGCPVKIGDCRVLYAVSDGIDEFHYIIAVDQNYIYKYDHYSCALIPMIDLFHGNLRMHDSESDKYAELKANNNSVELEYYGDEYKKYRLATENYVEEKVSNIDLSSAIDTALSQAKESGEFDGADGKNGEDGQDGVSCTHSWNGTTLSITSASGTSSVNLKGDKGDTGATGTNGIGIQSVTQTTTSTADDGNNVITVTLTNGTTSTFKVQNGSKGSTGATGANGYSPVRGTDYWTEADKAEIKSYIDNAILGGEW